MIKNTDKTRSILKYVMFFLLFSGVSFHRFELFSRTLWLLGFISLLVLAFMHYRHDTIACDESKKKRITIVNWICFIIIVAFIVLYLFLLLGVAV